MRVYEVNVEFDAAIRSEYMRWLHAHVDEILALPGFTGAEIFDVVDPAAPASTHRVCTQYRLLDDDALDTYLRDHAPRLRADGIARFGDRMRATRRVLQPVDAMRDDVAGTAFDG